MSNQFNRDEEMLARLVCEAGDPSVSPEPQYAETLRAMILNRLGAAETVAAVAEAPRQPDVLPIISLQSTRKMKRIVKFAVAATMLVAFGILVSWMAIGGGSTSMAFARVADALDSVRSATYDATSELKGDNGQPPATATGKGFFLAPSRQRMEVLANSAKTTTKMVVVSDSQAAKSIMLMPEQHIAMTMDMEKLRGKLKKSARSLPDLFETVRRLVREGSSGTREKAERLGKKEIDGRTAVGFHTRSNEASVTLWADPETARPVRVEVSGEMFADVHLVMDHFRYDVALDPSLFSLEPPAGYSTLATNMTMPVEEDLLRSLHTVAEHSKGRFPAKLGMNMEVIVAVNAGASLEMHKLEGEKIEAELNKVAAKYGGKEKLRAKYGKELPPAISAELAKAATPPPPASMAEYMKASVPLIEKEMQGITFYTMLKSENDPHYIGGGVKLGTADRPILWYKPTGADKYHVIYADLSVKDMTPDDVKKLPKVKPQ